MRSRAPSDSPINGGEYSYRTSRLPGVRVRGLATYTERQRELRINATVAEEALWKSIRSRKLLGKKFRRQHGIDLYIADFYCDETKLVIELDGSVHDTDEAKAYDQERDQYFLDMGYHVIRFQNYEVMEDLPNVLAKIELHFRGNPPPFMGELEGA